MDNIIWSAEALWGKSVFYIGRAFDSPREESDFPFYASLGIEFLIRSSVASIHPAMLADSTDVNNLLYAFGYTPKSQRFIPKSIPLYEALIICETIVPNFSKELSLFCLGMGGKRNEELHSGGTPFVNFKNASWLPRFFEVCEILLAFQGKGMESLFSPADIRAAEKLIASEKDAAAKGVSGLIRAHREVWLAKELTDRERLSAVAKSLALPKDGHVVPCPSCGCASLLNGEEVSQAPPSLEEGVIVIRKTVLPTEFRCQGCGLSIKGHNLLHAANLGDQFTGKVSYDPIEYYADDIEHFHFNPDTYNND